MGENILKDASDKELLSKMYKELFKFNSKKTNYYEKKNLANDLNKHIVREDIQTVDKYMKGCSFLYVIR